MEYAIFLCMIYYLTLDRVWADCPSPPPPPLPDHSILHNIIPCWTQILKNIYLVHSPFKLYQQNGVKCEVKKYNLHIIIHYLFFNWSDTRKSYEEIVAFNPITNIFIHTHNLLCYMFLIVCCFTFLALLNLYLPYSTVRYVILCYVFYSCVNKIFSSNEFSSLFLTLSQYNFSFRLGV